MAATTEPLCSVQFPNPDGIPAPSRALLPALTASNSCGKRIALLAHPRPGAKDRDEPQRAQILPQELPEPAGRRVGIHILRCPNPGRSLMSKPREILEEPLR